MAASIYGSINSKSDQTDMNTSIMSDISALNDGDFNMIIEHLLNTPKKTRRPKKSSRRKVHAAQSVPALNADKLFDVQEENEENTVNATFSAANTSYLSSFNDTCNTVNSDQFENIFAYFDQDVSTVDLLLSDDDNDDRHAQMPTENEKFTIKSQPAPPLPQSYPFAADKMKQKKKQSNRQEMKEIQNESKAILSKIQQFNGIEPRNNIGKQPLYTETNSRPVSVASTASTATVHDSDSDTVFKKPQNVVKKGNVRSKVAFFSDHSSSERSSSASPSIQSASDDEEFQFQRTQSKRKFEQNCNFFESFFKDKQSDQSILDTSTNCDANNKSVNFEKSSKNDHTIRRKKPPVDNNQIDAHEKLKAVQTYVQTQHLLERIERLVTTISINRANLDEKRLSPTNLKLIKKILTYLRDCSYNCIEICDTIGQNFLTDSERNDMSAEDLLYSALKMAHAAQVLFLSFELPILMNFTNTHTVTRF